MISVIGNKGFCTKILSSAFLMYWILMSCNKMLINYLKIIQCDFLDFCFRFRHTQLKCTSDKNWVGKPAKLAMYQILVLPTVGMVTTRLGTRPIWPSCSGNTSTLSHIEPFFSPVRNGPTIYQKWGRTNTVTLQAWREAFQQHSRWLLELALLEAVLLEALLMEAVLEAALAGSGYLHSSPRPALPG